MKITLDKLSADFSQRILGLIRQKVNEGENVTAESVEKNCTSALGILQEQGLYACILFLLTKSGDKKEQKELAMEELVACGILANLINLLNTEELKEIGCEYPNDWKGDPARVNGCKQELLNHISSVISGDLKKLLLVKSIYEQTLIYARYGAKALRVSESRL